MYKGQAFFIVTVFVVMFMLGIKNLVMTTPKYNLYAIDQMKVENIVSELENFIPKYFDEKDILSKLSEFENFIVKDDESIEIISVVLNKSNDKLYLVLLKKTFYPVNISLYVDGNEKINSELRSDYITSFNVSSYNNSIVVYVVYNGVKYSEEFSLSNNDISHFVIVSKKVSDKNIIVEHSNKVYTGIIST